MTAEDMDVSAIYTRLILQNNYDCCHIEVSRNCNNSLDQPLTYVLYGGRGVRKGSKNSGCRRINKSLKVEN